jgi:heptosyltransferase-2
MPPLFFSVRLPTLLAIFWRVYVGRNWSGSISQKKPLSFVIFRLDSLGDLVLTTPLFRALKTAYPKSHCTVVVQPQYKPLLVTNPHVDEILTLRKLEGRWLSQGAQRLFAALVLYWTQLRGRHFNFAISPRWDVDEHLATFLCVLTNAARRVGYGSDTSATKRQVNAGFDAAFDVCVPAGPVCHEVQRNLAVGKSMGAHTDDDRLEIDITDRDRRNAAKLLRDVPAGAKLIALGIGAHSSGRRWPLARYADAVNQLGAHINLQSVIVCSSAELGDAIKLDALLNRPAVIVSGARLREVCALLERSHLFIGNDSGCAHLAAAMGCKTLVISRHPRDGDLNHFNSPVRFSPHGSHVRILQPETGRDGCKDACTVHEPHCIRSVTVEEVVSASQQMLSDQVALTLVPVKSWMTFASQRLHQVQAADAVQQTVNTPRSGVEGPVL